MSWLLGLKSVVNLIVVEGGIDFEVFEVVCCLMLLFICILGCVVLVLDYEDFVCVFSGIVKV